VKHAVVWTRTAWELFEELPDRDQEEILEKLPALSLLLLLVIVSAHVSFDILPGLKSGDSYGLHAYAWIPSVGSCCDALTACEGCEQGRKAHGRNHS